ncbi:MAG: methane monooxygenase/ammonia monooxygenase subunit C [Cycloclasticus sp.]
MFQLEQTDIIGIELLYLALAWYIYKTLKRTEVDITRLAPMGEIKRSVALMCWLMVFVLVVFVSGGVLAHQDTAWHQISAGSEQVMPARMIIYAIFYPAYCLLGGSIWLYAKTRVSADVFNKNFKIALICITVAPFMFLPGQDPEMMTWSADWWNITYRTIYGLVNLLWISSLLYLIFRLIEKVASLAKQVGL